MISGRYSYLVRPLTEPAGPSLSDRWTEHACCRIGVGAIRIVYDGKKLGLALLLRSYTGSPPERTIGQDTRDSMRQYSAGRDSGVDADVNLRAGSEIGPIYT